MTYKEIPDCFRCLKTTCEHICTNGKCALEFVDLEDGECLSFETAGFKYCVSVDNFPDEGVTSCDVDAEEWVGLYETGKYALYTQVDGEDGEVYYLRGKHFVNRTGVYALIPKQ